MIGVQCEVFIMQCALCNVQCAVCSVQCSVCSGQCTLGSEECCLSGDPGSWIPEIHGGICGVLDTHCPRTLINVLFVEIKCILVAQFKGEHFSLYKLLREGYN